MITLHADSAIYDNDNATYINIIYDKYMNTSCLYLISNFIGDSPSISNLLLINLMLDIHRFEVSIYITHYFIYLKHTLCKVSPVTQTPFCGSSRTANEQVDGESRSLAVSL